LQRRCAPKSVAPADIFYVCAGAKYHGKALISCRAELVVSSSPSRFQLRGGRPPKISCPSAASIDSHHTMAELVQCSLINCWSHVQNVTRGPWPSMQGRGDGRRRRPWSDLPAPNVVIRKKSVLAVLTPKERARNGTKLQVAVSRVDCFLDEQSKLRYHQKCQQQAHLSRHREPTGGASARPMTGSAKQSNVRVARLIASSLRSSH
jgi:hypothetical protein